MKRVHARIACPRGLLFTLERSKVDVLTLMFGLSYPYTFTGIPRHTGIPRGVRVAQALIGKILPVPRDPKILPPTVETVTIDVINF
jgi:hypothetical protein